MSDSEPQKHGQALLGIVETRRSELEKELTAAKQTPDRTANLEKALAALKALMPGNPDQIPPAVAQGLSNWIETSKYLTA